MPRNGLSATSVPIPTSWIYQLQPAESLHRTEDAQRAGNVENLRYASGELSDIYSFHSAKIRNSALVKGIGFYETAIHKFLGNSVIKRLEGIDFRTNEEIRARLKPDTSIGSGEWVDISGLIAPKVRLTP